MPSYNFAPFHRTRGFPSSALNPTISAGGRIIGQAGPRGAHWYVDSTATNAKDPASASDFPASGQSPNSPFATLNGAFQVLDYLDRDNLGDVIHVGEGHAETITAASGLDCDVAGVQVVGYGSGTKRPTFTFTTATAADCDVDAANITFYNLLFVCNIASQVYMIDVSANGDGFHLLHCELREGSATGVSMLGLLDADDVVIEGNRFITPTAGNYDEAIHINAALDRLVIRDNYIYGDFDDAAVHNPTGNVATRLLIEGNSIVQLQSGDHAIELVSACTGVYRNNALVTDAAATAIDPGSMSDGGGNTWGSTSADTGAAPLNPVPDSASNILGADDSNNLFASTNVARNADGSIIERLEDLKADLSGTAGIATFPAAAEAANAVSMAEVLRNISDLQVPRIVLKSTGDMSSGYGTGDSPVTLFTVTGDVLCRCFASVDVNCTSTSNNGTLEVGVAGNTASLLVQDVVDGTAFQAGDSWSLITAADANGAQVADEWLHVGNGADIILTIATNNMTAGDIDIYCQYIPCTAGSSVVAA